MDRDKRNEGLDFVDIILRITCTNLAGSAIDVRTGIAKKQNEAKDVWTESLNSAGSEGILRKTVYIEELCLMAL